MTLTFTVPLPAADLVANPHHYSLNNSGTPSSYTLGPLDDLQADDVKPSTGTTTISYGQPRFGQIQVVSGQMVYTPTNPDEIRNITDSFLYTIHHSSGNSVTTRVNMYFYEENPSPPLLPENQPRPSRSHTTSFGSRNRGRHSPPLPRSRQVMTTTIH